MAVRFPDLAAAVPFYGRQPSAEDTAKIKAPLLIHYAGDDQGINAGWPAWEAALKKDGVRYRAYMYPGAQHGFHNDTTPRYDEAAAKLAWSRTLDVLQGEPEALVRATAALPTVQDLRRYAVARSLFAPADARCAQSTGSGSCRPIRSARRHARRI